jgi:cytochrome c
MFPADRPAQTSRMVIFANGFRGLHFVLSGQRCPYFSERAMKTATLSVFAFVCMSAFTAYAQADAKKGKTLYETRCGICHSLTENRVGPSHKDLIGRKAGIVPGYEYSAGFAKTNLVWNEKNLDAWIAFPENLIEGQKMGFYVMEADARADIIAYLKQASAAK